MAGAGYLLFVAGQVLTAAQVNTYLEQQSIMAFASGSSRDTALSSVKAENMYAALADVNTLTVYSGSAWSTIGPTHGALTSWTPAVTQTGSVTVTNNASAYTRTGRWVQGYFDLSVTGSGTLGAPIYVSLPVTAALSSVAIHLGNGRVSDSSAGASGIYNSQMVLASSTLLEFVQISANNFNVVGNVPSFALASGDLLSGTFAYQAAADA